MFGKKTIEEEIIIEADKIASLKENFDAMSWNRVSEIATAFQKDVDPDTKQELVRELMAISHANTDLLGKLGISESAFSGKVMPSGIEMFEEGIALDAEQPQKEPKKEKRSGTLFGSTKKNKGILPDLGDEPTDFFSAPHDDDSFIPRGVAVTESPKEEPVALTSAMVKSLVAKGEVDIEPEVLAALLEDLAAQETCNDQVVKQDNAPKVPVYEKTLDSDLINEEAKIDSPVLEDEKPEEKKKSFFSRRAEKKKKSKAEQPQVKEQDFARFSQIYSSRDGALCLYRDGDGHIVAVDASKLA